MKDLLCDIRFRYWPVCSVAYYALREKLLSVSLSTWYHYIRKLGINRPSVPKKKKYITGIISSRPDQIWHADITIVKTKDNIRHYVYLLMNNYSRFILNWRIEPVVSAEIRLETIKDAYIKYKKAFSNIILITDGGPENDNNVMQGFLSETSQLNMCIALKDVPFSNSVIEAQNKLFKYRYLFRQEYNDEKELITVFQNDVNDYNSLRPHISLKGYTPFEVHSGFRGLEKVWSDQTGIKKQDH